MRSDHKPPSLDAPLDPQERAGLLSNLVAASGCASVARRICDLLAMSGYPAEHERKAAEMARDMLSLGAVRATAFLEAKARVRKCPEEAP